MYAVGKPVKMTDIDNFTTTHYHIKEEYAVDKAKPVEQVDLLLFFIEQDAINYRCFFVQYYRQCFVYPWLFFISQIFSPFSFRYFYCWKPILFKTNKKGKTKPLRSLSLTKSLEISFQYISFLLEGWCTNSCRRGGNKNERNGPRKGPSP